jgi:hypothetical protein
MIKIISLYDDTHSTDRGSAPILRVTSPPLRKRRGDRRGRKEAHVLARLVVAVLIAVGAIALGVISYAFFTSRSDLSRFALTERARGLRRRPQGAER